VVTDNIKLIGKISALRPKAFVIVFTDNPHVKGAVAIRFGVYCYLKGDSMKPEIFLRDHGFKYGFANTDTAKFLQIEAEGEKIVTSRITRVN
jgi:pyruvate kinase